MDMEDLLLLEPRSDYDECIVGVITRAGGDTCVCYSAELILRVLERSGMSPEDAEEFMSFNITSAYLGPGTPAFLWKFSEDA